MNFLLFFGTMAAVLLSVVFLHNRLVRSRNLADEGWSGIDVQLRRRADLIPNLVATVQAYATHERSVFEQVTRARSATLDASDIDAHTAAANCMQIALPRLLAVAEAYPALNADRNFRQLADELASVEDELQLARRYYNGTTRNFNILIESFPSNLIARFFGFRKYAYFNIGDEAARNVPEVSPGSF
ncbi:MAG: LemA family protein [Alphaproteobacteria bacterium]|nr:LemA family protein [Alphaproteobacteria bacterium]